MVRIGKRFQLGVVAGLAILAAGCNNPFVAGLGSSVDLDAPVVRITSPANGSYVRGAITLSGQWNDDKGVTEGRVTITDQNTSSQNAVLPLTINPDKTWSVVVNTGLYPDGEKLLAVVVKDDSGRETETRTLLYFDNTPPIATVNLPADPAAFYNGLVRISGEAYDAFGVQRVDVEIYSDSSLSTLLVSGTAEGTATWNYQFNSAAYVSTVQDLAYVVKVLDRAGNPSQYFFHYPEVFSFNGNQQITIDKIYQITQLSDPNGTVPPHVVTRDQLIGTSGIKRTQTILKIDQDSDKPVFTISSPDVDGAVMGPGAKAVGLVEDDDGFDTNHNFQFEVKPVADPFNDADFVSGADVTGSGLLLRFKFTLPSAIGQYKMRLRIRDMYGRESISPVRTFRIDTGIPLVEITEPARLYFSSTETITLTGSASSSGGQINSMDYSKNGGPWTPIPAGNITGLNTPNATWSVSIPLSGIPDGPFTLAIRATDDNMGNPKTGSSTITLRADTTNPTSTLITPSTAERVYRQRELRGTTSDNNAVSEVWIRIGADTTWVAPTGIYSWSYTIPNTNVYANTTHGTLETDGSYRVAVEVRVRDIASNEVTNTHYIYVDPEKDKPTSTIISPPADATLGGTFTVGGTAVDEDPGVGAVEIQLLALQGTSTTVIGAVDPNTGNAVSDTVWFPATFAAGSWSFTFTENVKFYNVGQTGHAYPGSTHSGWYFLRVRARDSQSTPVVGDWVQRRFRMYNAAQAPQINVNALARSHYRSIDTINLSGTAQVPAGAVGQIVSEVRVSFDGGTPVVATLTPAGGAASVSWTANVPVPNQGAFNGQKTVTIEADGRNQANDVNTGYANVYVNIDTMLPTASLLSPANNQVVYRDVTLSGTASDNSAVQTVEIRVGKVGTWGAVTGLYGWSHAIANSNTLANATHADWNATRNAWEVPVQIRVTDIAGNQSITNGSFFVNPDNDKPSVSVIAPAANGIMPGDFVASGTAFDERPGVQDVQFQLVALVGTTTTEIGNVDPVTGNAATAGTWFNTTLSGGQWSYTFTENVKLYNVSLTGNAYPGTGHEGWYLLKVRARDSQGTPVVSDVVTRRFRIFKAPLSPSVTVNTLSNIYYRGTQVVNLSGTATVPTGHPDLNIKSGDGIQISFDGSAYTAAGVTISPNPDMKSVTWTANYTLPALPSVNGSRTFNIKAISVNAVGTQAEGFTSTFVIIDSTPPTSAFTNPPANATVYGMVPLRGTTSDNNSVSRVELRLGLPNTWIDITGSLYNWSYNFNADTLANATYATWNSTESVWILPIEQRVTDVAGNVYTQTGFQLKIDTDRDKPTVQFIAPQDGANIAGPALVNGTAFDESPGLLRVEMRIAALEGETGTTIVNGGNGYVDFNGNASPASTWHVLTGTSLWSVELNTNGRFYNVGKAGMAYPALPDTGPGSHAGRFLLEVRAVDGNNKIGNSVTRIIRFDDSIPKFDSMNISQYSFVRGVITITGTLSDDEQISNAQISFDGGQSYTALTAGTDYTVVDIKTYNLHITIDTETDTRIPAAIRTNKNGILNLRLRATDNANYMNIHYLDLYVDNYYPSGTFTIVPGVTPDDLNNPPGGRALLRGSASDDGPGVVIKNIEKVEVYFTRGTNVLRISDGNTQAYVNVDFGNGQGLRPYTTDPAYKIEILRTHIYAVDFKEIQVDGTDFVWLAGFDSRNFPDGALTIHYVIHDKAGNRTHGTQAGFVKNNKPVITSVTTGTDLNYSDVVEVAERFTYTGNFNARNRLYLQINATGGNGTLNYAVLEGASPVPGAPSGTTNSGTVNISAFSDGPRTYTLRVTDGVGIEVEQTFTYTVAQVDSTAPTIQIYALNQTDTVIPNQGQLQETANNPLNPGVRPAVSGTIRIKGEARDNMRLREIRLTVPGVGTNVLVAEWDTTTKTLVSRNANFVIDAQDLSVSGGHVVFYTFTWNTASVPNRVGSNVGMTLSAQDFRSGPPPAVTANASFDVVPYITAITTSLSIASPTVPSVLARSALGRYPVWRKLSIGAEYETITVRGYNLNPSAGVVVSKDPDGVNATFNGFAAGAQQVNAARITEVTAGTEYRINLQDITASGYLNFVANVSGTYIPTINNIDNNTLPQNKEPNNRNNNLLTNDRWLDIWDINQLNFGDVRMVDMEVQGNTINWGMGYMDDRAGVSINNAAPTLLRQSYTRYFDNKLAFNSAGQYFFVAQCADTYLVPVNAWNRPSHFGLVYRAAPTTPWEYGNTASARKLYIESNWNGAEINKLDRVQWPDMKVLGDAANSRIYLSYYDSMQKILKFRYNQIGTAALPAGYTGTTIEGGVNMLQVPYTNGAVDWTQTTQSVLVYTSGANTYHQGYVTIAGADQNSPFSAVAYLSDGTAIVLWYDAVGNRLMMKYNTSPATSFSGYQMFNNNTDPTAGTYRFRLTVDGVAQNGGNDIEVVLAATPVGMRYHLAHELNRILSENYGATAEINPVTQRLVVRSMQTGPTSSISMTAPSSGTSLLTQMGGVGTPVNGVGQSWVTRVLDTDFGGKFVSVAVDGSNGIHVAYQRTSTGDLRYLYLSSLTAAPQIVTVDNYLQVGLYTDITVRFEDVNGDSVNEWIPYIGYFNISNADTRMSAKVARLVVPPAQLGDGADENELFTGKWEITTVPAREVPKQYRVNVGITTAGNLIVGYAGDRVEYATYRP